MHIISSVEYEWDAGKAEAKRKKHGVDFAEAVTVLIDPLAVTIPDTDPEEDRFVTIGQDALGRTIVLAYTYRSERIRPISARKATRSERRQYEEKR